jgi:hypothetical protein
MAKHFEITKYEDHPGWNRIDSKGKFADWEFDFSNGELCITCYDGNGGGSNTIFLTPDQMKQLIEFIQEGLDLNDGVFKI